MFFNIMVAPPVVASRPSASLLCYHQGPPQVLLRRHPWLVTGEVSGFGLCMVDYARWGMVVHGWQRVVIGIISVELCTILITTIGTMIVNDGLFNYDNGEHF